MRKYLNALLESGDQLTVVDEAAHVLPSLSAALAAVNVTYPRAVTVRHVNGPVRKTIITFVDCPLTVDDSDQGGSVQLLDFPEGVFEITRAEGTLTFTTSSEIATTLNASKVILWSVGTKAAGATPFAAGSLLTRERNILGPVSAVSSATINVANTATSGIRTIPIKLRGHAVAPDLYLNVAVPTNTDIDGDATVLVNGSIVIFHTYAGDIATANDSRSPSADIWDTCPWGDIEAGKVDGLAYFDEMIGNFTQANNVAAAASTLPSPFAAFTGATAGGTVTMPADAPFGVVALNNTTDNETTCMVMGGKGGAGQLVIEAGKLLWFETRIKINTIDNTKLGGFIGLGEEGLAVTVGICAANDTLTDKDLIGFFHDAADGDALDIVYNTAGGGGVTTSEADAVTLAADTYVKLGIVSDGTNVYFYANGTLIKTVAISATNVPDGEELCVYWAMTSSGGDDIIMSVDWVKVAQQRA